MWKKTLKIAIISIFSLPIVYFAVYLIQNQTLKKSYVTYNEGQGADSFIRCNLNIIEPEIADVYFTGDEGNISFKKTKMFYQTDEEWRQSRIGGTTVINTTFDELVEMIKDDCSQFQEDYDNPLVDEGGIDWGYREADPSEPPKTEEDLEYEKMQDIIGETRSTRYMFNETFTDFQQEKFTEMFGDPNSMKPEEIYEMKQGIYNNGGLEVVFKDYLFDEGGNLIAR